MEEKKKEQKGKGLLFWLICIVVGFFIVNVSSKIGRTLAEKRYNDIGTQQMK